MSFVETVCEFFYAETMGRPSMPPAVYFRLLLIGYFEGGDSECGIAWRVADSLSLREFLGYELTDATPDHSTISRTRRLIDLEAHQDVFAWVLRVLARRNLVTGKSLGIDATTLEANAALRSIVRRDIEDRYQEFLEGLAKASGIDTPPRRDLVEIDRNRRGKGSKKEWKHPHDPDARITKMKDGRTHLGHKAEHAVDLDTGAVLGVTLQPADLGDTQSFEATIEAAMDGLAETGGRGGGRQALRPGLLRHRGGQGRPQQRGAHRPAPPWHPHLRPRAETRPQELEEQERGESRRLRQPAQNPRSAGQAALDPAPGTHRTQLRALLRHRRSATNPPPGSRQHPEASARPHRGLQPGTRDAEDGGSGHSAGACRA